MGKTAIVTGVSLGLATSFLGCHFGGTTEKTTTEPTSSEPPKQENLASSESSLKTETAPKDAQKQSRSHKHIKTEGDDLKLDFRGDENASRTKNTQPLSSDTIDIIYEMPALEPDGTLPILRTTTAPTDFKNICPQPSVEPVFPGGEDTCKRFIQQHFRITPKLRQYLQGKRIFFVFVIEKNGQVAKADAQCANVYKSQKS